MRALTDETATTVDTRGYEAFGSKNTEAGNDPLTYGFAGEPFQQDSMLAYHRARWMDARAGRFEGMDAVATPVPPNLYVYANNQPTSRIDPTGRDGIDAEPSFGHRTIRWALRFLGSHHTNQTSRKDGATMDATSVRGVSGIVDGTRWVSVVQVERITTDEDKVESVVTLSMAKSNYSMIAAPVVLRYGEGGVLVPMSADERAEAGKVRDAADPRARKERKREEAKSSRNVQIDNAVVACVKATLGIDTGTLRKQVKAMAGCGSDAADTSVERLVLAGRVRREQDGKTTRHFIVEPAPEPPPKPEATVTNGVNGTGMAVHDHVPSLDDV